MKKGLKDIEIDAELSVETDTGSVDIFNTDGELNIEFSNWDTLKESRKILPDKFKSLNSFNSFNKLLNNSGLVLNISVKGDNVAKLGKSQKPDLEITKLLFGSIFK